MHLSYLFEFTKQAIFEALGDLQKSSDSQFELRFRVFCRISQNCIGSHNQCHQFKQFKLLSQFVRTELLKTKASKGFNAPNFQAEIQG